MTWTLALSIAITITGATGMYFSGRNKWWGWLIGLCAQPIWFAFGIVNLRRWYHARHDIIDTALTAGPAGRAWGKQTMQQKLIAKALKDKHHVHEATRTGVICHAKPTCEGCRPPD